MWLVHHILLFTVRAHMTLQRIQNLNGLSIIYYRSQPGTHNALMYTKLEWLVYHILSFTVRAHTWRSNTYKTWMVCSSYFIIHSPRTHDAPTYTKLEWLVHRILSFTVHAHTMLRRTQNFNSLSIVPYSRLFLKKKFLQERQKLNFQELNFQRLQISKNFN